MLLAEVAPDGAPKCAGLEVHRYGAEEMADRPGPEFTLIRTEQYPYINQLGTCGLTPMRFISGAVDILKHLRGPL